MIQIFTCKPPELLDLPKVVEILATKSGPDQKSRVVPLVKGLLDEFSLSFRPSLKNPIPPETKNSQTFSSKSSFRTSGRNLGSNKQILSRLLCHNYHLLEHLTTWLQIWYHSLLWGDGIRKGTDLEKQNCLLGVQPAELGKKLLLLLLLFFNKSR